MKSRRYLLALVTLSVTFGCTEPTLNPTAPADAPPALERIIFSSLRPSNWDIYYLASRGAEPKRLTDHPGLDYDAEFSPDGAWVIFTSERRGNPDLYVLDLQDGGAPRLLIDSMAMEDQATLSPDGEAIAFVSTEDGNADIFVMPFDPTGTRRMEEATNLTRHPGGDFRPAFSPDGNRIAFSSDRDTPVYGHPFLGFTRQREGELYVMDRDGNNSLRLTESANWDGSPEWTPDGETIYFYSDRPRELPGPPTSPILGQEGGFRIWAIDADGSNPRPITPEGVEALAPVLTPDGRIAFQTRAGYTDWTIQSVRPDGSDLRLESDEANDYWMPDYHIESGAMVSHGVGPVTAESQAVEAVLGAGALLAADYPTEIELPDRSIMIYPMRHTSGLAPHPYQNEVVTTIENEAGTRLVVANFDGTDQRELLEERGIGIVSGSGIRLLDMKWSDDGNWITYTRGAFFGGVTDQADVWIVRRDGSERVNLTASEANDGVAAFSPDGQELVFRSSRNGNVDLYLMNTDGSNLRQLTDDPARENFPVFSPDGNAIAFASDRDGEEDRFGFRTFDNYILQILPDGSPGELQRITDDPGQDAHPWYSPDGEWIVYTSEQAGITDEEPLVQEAVFGPQMYGEIFAYRLSDGLTIRLTHNKWEEGSPYWMRAAGTGSN